MAKKYKLHPELVKDLKELARAKRPEDLTRFTTPDWWIKAKEFQKLRKRLGASQSQLAKAFHISVKTVQHWEQIGGASGPGSVLLRLLDRHPKLYSEIAAQP